MLIDAELCGGSIHLVREPQGGSAELALRHDSASPIRQWFHFRVRGARGSDLELSIINAGEASCPHAYYHYRALASYDLERWFRIDTHFDGRRLVLRHRPDDHIIHYSYFAAYPLDRQRALLARASNLPWAGVESIGRSIEGRSIDLLTFGSDGPGKRRIWISARQHSGETMSAFFAEGVIERLMDGNDEVTRALVDSCVIFVAPNVNPDGSARGNFRTNAAGRDLNREWSFPSSEASPEVLALRSAMERVGVDLFLDIHGDETEPCIFAVGCAGNPRYSDRQHWLERQFAKSLANCDPGFSPEHDYGPNDPGKGDLRIANNWVGERFDCLSMTVEMPYKDVPPAEGFSPDRARAFGRRSLECVLESLGALR
jgi:murein tripeptide amidase MpaA